MARAFQAYCSTTVDPASPIAGPLAVRPHIIVHTDIWEVRNDQLDSDLRDGIQAGRRGLRSASRFFQPSTRAASVDSRSVSDRFLNDVAALYRDFGAVDKTSSNS